jgi:type II secretory pathway component PulC
MRDNISPEEKLLRLIRGERKPPAGASAAQSAARAAKAAAFEFKLPDLKFHLEARKAILIILVLSCIYLVFAFIYPFVFLRTVKLPVAAKGSLVSLEVIPKTEQKPLEEYLQGLGDKQVFGSGGSVGVIGPASGLSAELIKDINLVGIIAGENPQAIIEDKKGQKTYYLNKGQSIGEFQVEDIQEGKIILNFNGQRFELHL